MDLSNRDIAEAIQSLAVRVISTHSVGVKLHLIGGFRYRLLDSSARTSADIDYHWEGDLAQKQDDLVEVVRDKLLPEVKRQFGYDGDAHPAAGPEAESPAVRIVDLAFYRAAEPGSRIEIPIEITRIVRLDAPIVRIVGGAVVLTVSDADMIESKIVALLSSHYCRVRDVLDLFLFRDALLPESPARLVRKFAQAGMSFADAEAALERFERNRAVHLREMEQLLAGQVDTAAAENLRAAGGGDMIWTSTIKLLRDLGDGAREGLP